MTNNIETIKQIKNLYKFAVINGEKKPVNQGWKDTMEKTFFKTSGIPCGLKNNITVIDLDIIKKQIDIKNKNVVCGVKFIQENYPELLNSSFAVKTNSKCLRKNCCNQSNGIHLYFIYDPDILTSTNSIIVNKNVKIDIRNDNSYVVLYEDIFNLALFETVPQEFKECLKTKENEKNKEIKEVIDIQNDDLLIEKLEEYIDTPVIYSKYENYFRIDYNRKKGCPFNKVHTNNACSVYKYKNEYRLSCFSGKCQGEYKVLNLQDDEEYEDVIVGETDKIDKHILEQFEGNEDEITLYNNNFMCYFKELGFGFRETITEPFIIYKNEINLINAFSYLYGRKIKYYLDCWKYNINRLNYKDIHFSLTEKEGYYNLFTGYDIKRNDYNEDNVAEFKKYLLDIWASGNIDIYNYLIKYLAHLLQKGKNEVMLVLQGKKGIGKSKLVNLFMKYIIGQKYSIKLNNYRDLIGKFNFHLQNVLLVYLDEPVDLGDKSQSIQEALKDIITQDTQKIEKKNVDAYQIESLATYILSTNGFIPVKFTDGNRRFFVIECSDIRQGDIQYFKDFHDYFVENKEDIFNFLMSVDLSNVITLQDFPETEAMKEIEMLSKSPVDTFIDEEVDLENEIDANKLFIEFNKYRELNYPNHKSLNVKMFFNRLRNKYFIERKQILNKYNGKREWKNVIVQKK